MGRNAANDLQEATTDHDEPPNGTSPSPQKAIATLLGRQLLCHWCINRLRGWRWCWATSVLHQPCLKRCRNSLPKGKKGVSGYYVCFAEVTPLFLGLRSIADDQVPCHQGSVAATNPLRQNIPVVDMHEIYTIKYSHIYIFCLTFMLFCDWLYNIFVLQVIRALHVKWG